mmetsp:Transcript_23721/g.33206  ORF Transcript_23721/g.33206 Transcript_23721/m.33206 type:complete len:140 (-) Transcript_23721:76-495(-)|eukprot:CAMPEP_0185252712 /NCGR_PEP_ID=MMETSP1359-20130426/1720_1 /TAXON_ID=552665 /ORGANISM="Bigelowiella longifila, Strain CCMP242" /LENGTH=139 /DNA_ID=CAMNT_0027834949 /DNA_START=278 /DNA_END=697 /DNA_ORIENTATION=-
MVIDIGDTASPLFIRRMGFLIHLPLVFMLVGILFAVVASIIYAQIVLSSSAAVGLTTSIIALSTMAMAIYLIAVNSAWAAKEQSKIAYQNESRQRKWSEKKMKMAPASPSPTATRSVSNHPFGTTTNSPAAANEDERLM